MRSFTFYSMILLMIVWTAIFIMELAFVYFTSSAVATFTASGYSLTDVGQFYVTIREGLWTITSGARVAVWALPMIVMAIISAVSQPTAR
jgi:hypothetical protein